MYSSSLLFLFGGRRRGGDRPAEEDNLRGIYSERNGKTDPTLTHCTFFLYAQSAHSDSFDFFLGPTPRRKRRTHGGGGGGRGGTAAAAPPYRSLLLPSAARVHVFLGS